MPTVTIWKEFTFDAAHRLPRVPAGHPCGHLHGHTYRVRFEVRGEIDEHGPGWVRDFAEIKEAWKETNALLDHRCLNDVDGLENPTCEVLAVWILGRMPRYITAIEVSETPSSGCRYEP